MDEEAQDFTTVSFDLEATLKETPEGGWQDIFDPEQLVIRTTGTVVMRQETTGVTVDFSGIRAISGAEQHNRGFRWRRDEV